MDPSQFLSSVDVTQPSFWISAGSIVFNPLMWNIVARNEYRNKTIAKVLGSPLAGCYFLAFTIFTLGLLRDWLFTVALKDQPTLPILEHLLIKIYAGLLVAVGNVLVLTSMFKLGVTGTYLGDYFGILMEERVVGFPFNVLENPMYFGSTMCFFGGALWSASPAGVVLSLVVHFVYAAAIRYEGPFTTMIYQKRDESRKKAR
ncbi:phospholipid methyltransferase-domain-containing protein [Blyttiomyces helicus]|uniref:Phosphatidyl-N-methylethanolamine N-methyltransferase n=1 Tax=Blyttiomyces helicus TaxID=388810 RepID=A0A4P9WF58_9FUNG|nr:phospholipid methyltransferase-domain-containing protein [Blyttiomyces helicus]|eukprot:RKO89938.1 phospholipid methyltransferase-domain-containing protein [Blyttiomyces helicus]